MCAISDIRLSKGTAVQWEKHRYTNAGNGIVKEYQPLKDNEHLGYYVMKRSGTSIWACEVTPVRITPTSHDVW